MTLPVTDPVLIVAIAMVSFLIMPLISKRLHLPDLIGILLAGVLIGPFGIGLLERDATIQLLGTVGLLYLVFLAGLEVDLGDLNRKRKLAFSFGISTFLVPQIIGTIGAAWLFDFSIGPAILMGSVFSSHSFLALLIAKRMGLTDRELVIAVIGGTVITDTLALFVLAVVAQSTAGSFGVWFVLSLLLQTAVFATVVVFGLPVLGRWFFREVTDGGAHFVFILTVLFTCGYVAHLVGLEPIIGAFLAGLGMNRLVPHKGVLANRVFFFGDTFFVPFFLLSVGMLIDLKMVFGDARTIEMAIFMTLTVVFCKGLAAWLMRLFFSYSRDDVIVAWGLSLPQAATTLAVVLVGHKIDLFDDAVLNATIVMVFVTCVLGPILVQVAGRRLATSVVPHELSESEARLQRILIPLANPQSSNNLLDLAMALRRPLANEPLLPLSVAANEEGVANSERLLATSVLHVAAADVEVTPVIRVDINPVNGILRALAEMRGSTLVIGWAGPQAPWQRHFHLSRGVIDELIDETTIQLLAVRLCAPLAVLERVVLAIPANAASEHGFVEIIGDCKLLTKRIGATLMVVGDGAKSTSAQEQINLIGSKCPTTFEYMPSDNDGLVEGIAQILTAKDLVIIIGCREGTNSWDSRWGRLPTRLAHRVPNLSLAVAYPRIERMYFSTAAAHSNPDSELLDRVIAHVNSEAASLPEVINDSLADCGFNHGQLAVLIEQLLQSVSAFNANVAFAHAHTILVTRPQLVAVVTRQPLQHNGLNLRVVLTLLNPLGMPAEQHLSNLSIIAGIIRDQGSVDALLAATDTQAVQQVFSAGH